MKKIIQLIILFCFSLTLILSALVVNAFEKDMLVECIASARENTAIEGASESSIASYCECALNLIVDQNQDVRESGYKCATKNFQ